MGKRRGCNFEEGEERLGGTALFSSEPKVRLKNRAETDGSQLAFGDAQMLRRYPVAKIRAGRLVPVVCAPGLAEWGALAGGCLVFPVRG